MNGGIDATQGEMAQRLKRAKVHADEHDPLTSGQALSAEQSARECTMRETPKPQYSLHGAVQYLFMD